MSRRNAYLVAAGVLSLAVVLLLPSFTARAVAACLVLLVGAFLLAKVFSKPATGSVQSRQLGEDLSGDESSQEIFALGKLFEATMGGMREGLLVVDKDMRVVASNAASHKLFNPARGKLEAQRLTELTRNPAIYSAFLDALQGTERSGVKVETHGPERLVFDLRVVPLVSSGGRARVSERSNGRASAGANERHAAEGALGVFIDVTRIERLELVRQEFLSNVSHELRTPLTAIMAFAETLESGAIDDPDASGRFLEIIRKNATRMHDLIDDILELSAIEAGNVRVRTEQVELHPIVNDVIALLAAQAKSQGVVVTNAIPGDAKVYADARRLEQMLTNLVENAIKFNRENGTVTIRWETGAGDKIIVEDSGEGIPAQHLERLFERFYRVDRARSRELGGTGLGLAIVKHLARAHGGEVSVTSELGKGSVFLIELPARP